MNFEDIFKVKGAPQDGFDEDGNPIEQPEGEWQTFGKCVILPNTQGSSTCIRTRFMLLSQKQNTLSYRRKAKRFG